MTHSTDRPLIVEARRLTPETADAVAAWADGTIDHRGDLLIVRLPMAAIPVVVGDWAVRDVLDDELAAARPVLAVIFEWAYQPTGDGRYRRIGT